MLNTRHKIISLQGKNFSRTRIQLVGFNRVVFLDNTKINLVFPVILSVKIFPNGCPVFIFFPSLTYTLSKLLYIEI